MHFDGVARRDGAGAGVVFVSPKKHILPYLFVLTQLFSNRHVLHRYSPSMGHAF